MDDTWSGQVRIRLIEARERTALHRALHGLPLFTGVSWCQLTVSNPMLPAWSAGSAPGGSADGGPRASHSALSSPLAIHSVTYFFVLVQDCGVSFLAEAAGDMSCGLMYSFF